jgi:hypothetical protein
MLIHREFLHIWSPVTQTLLGEYPVPGGDSLESIALDETTNMLYVSGNAKIFKLNAGAPSALPTLVDTLALDAADGTLVKGMALDTANGYGAWEGTNSSGKGHEFE